MGGAYQLTRSPGVLRLLGSVKERGLELNVRPRLLEVTLLFWNTLSLWLLPQDVEPTSEAAWAGRFRDRQILLTGGKPHTTHRPPAFCFCSMLLVLKSCPNPRLAALICLSPSRNTSPQWHCSANLILTGQQCSSHRSGALWQPCWHLAWAWALNVLSFKNRWGPHECVCRTGRALNKCKGERYVELVEGHATNT